MVEVDASQGFVLDDRQGWLVFGFSFFKMQLLSEDSEDVFFPFEEVLLSRPVRIIRPTSREQRSRLGLIQSLNDNVNDAVVELVVPVTQPKGQVSELNQRSIEGSKPVPEISRVITRVSFSILKVVSDAQQTLLRIEGKAYSRQYEECKLRLGDQSDCIRVKVGEVGGECFNPEAAMKISCQSIRKSFSCS